MIPHTMRPLSRQSWLTLRAQRLHRSCWSLAHTGRLTSLGPDDGEERWQRQQQQQSRCVCQQGVKAGRYDRPAFPSDFRSGLLLEGDS